MINVQVNYGPFKHVYVSHLLCSGKLFPNDPDKTLELVNETKDVMDFGLIDTSNLWEEIFTNTSGSGNNVLKTAVAASSASITGEAINRRIVEVLLQELERRNLPLDEIQLLLAAPDNYPLGSMTIPEFLVRQGNEDLALHAVNLGAQITPKLLISAAGSAGTTQWGTILLHTLLYRVVSEPIHGLDELTIKKFKYALLAANVTGAYDKQLQLIEHMRGKGEQDARKHLDYLKSIEFRSVYIDGDEFLFDKFTHHYREEDDGAFRVRSEYFEKHVEEYLELLEMVELLQLQ